jgi:hypothetical protein
MAAASRPVEIFLSRSANFSGTFAVPPHCRKPLNLGMMSIEVCGAPSMIFAPAATTDDRAFKMPIFNQQHAVE